MTGDARPQAAELEAARALASVIPPDWRTALEPSTSTLRFVELAAFLADERRTSTVYPAPEQVFAALRLTPLDAVRAVILGQDPYHRPGQAHGLAFSVPAEVDVPPSLRNIHTEVVAELRITLPQTGSLVPWATRGVLLLNTVLTVRAGSAGSHRRRGWEEVTDEVIVAVNRRPGPVVFLLWGAAAKSKARLVDPERHIVLEAAHPSPFSVRGFRGKAGFAEANHLLRARGMPEIDWSLS